MQCGHHAFVVHRTCRRVRIRIPARRRHCSFFEDLRSELAGREGIVAVRVNSLTASIVIEHDARFDLAALRDPSLGLDLVYSEPEPPHRGQAVQPLARIDESVRALSGGEINLASVIAKLVLATISGQPGALIAELGVGIVTRAALGLAGSPRPHERRADPVASDRPLALPASA